MTDGYESDPEDLGKKEVSIKYRVGRPDIAAQFEENRAEIAKQELAVYPTRVSTFVSVPEMLEKLIASSCKQYSDRDVTYVFTSETFML